MPSNSFKLGSPLTLEALASVVEGRRTVLPSSALKRVAASRRVLETAMAAISSANRPAAWAAAQVC